MVISKRIMAVDALIAVLCAVAAILYANAPSRPPTTRNGFTAPLDRTVDAARGNAATGISLSARHVQVVKTVSPSAGTAVNTVSASSATTASAPSPPTDRPVHRQSLSTSTASVAATAPRAGAPAPATCANGDRARCMPMPLPRVPLPRVPLPRVPLPRVPLPHVPLPHVLPQIQNRDSGR